VDDLDHQIRDDEPDKKHRERHDEASLPFVLTLLVARAVLRDGGGVWE
jgi:hypothetical protein